MTKPMLISSCNDEERSKDSKSNKGVKMSRIDVVPSEKGKFTVLVNFVQFGVALSSALLANKTAEDVQAKQYPHAELHLTNIPN